MSAFRVYVVLRVGVEQNSHQCVNHCLELTEADVEGGRPAVLIHICADGAILAGHVGVENPRLESNCRSLEGVVVRDGDVEDELATLVRSAGRACEVKPPSRDIVPNYRYGSSVGRVLSEVLKFLVQPTDSGLLHFYKLYAIGSIRQARRTAGAGRGCALSPTLQGERADFVL